MNLNNAWRRKKDDDYNDEEELPIYTNKVRIKEYSSSKWLEYIGIAAISIILFYLLLYFSGILNHPHLQHRDYTLDVMNKYDIIIDNSELEKGGQVTRVNFDLTFDLSENNHLKFRYPREHGLFDMKTEHTTSYKLCCKFKDNMICANQSDKLICALRNDHLIIHLHKDSFFSKIDKLRVTISCGFIWYSKSL